MDAFLESVQRLILEYYGQIDVYEHTAKLKWEDKPRPKGWLIQLVIENGHRRHACLQTYKAHRTWDEIKAGIPPSYSEDIDHARKCERQYTETDGVGQSGGELGKQSLGTMGRQEPGTTGRLDDTTEQRDT